MKITVFYIEIGQLLKYIHMYVMYTNTHMNLKLKVEVNYATIALLVEFINSEPEFYSAK